MPTIQTDHQPTLRGLMLLSNREEYALTLEQHDAGSGQPNAYAVSLHGDFSALTISARAQLANELLVLRNLASGPLYSMERTQDDAEWEEFLGVYGFKPSQSFPCHDGHERRLFMSPAVGDAPTR